MNADGVSGVHVELPIGDSEGGGVRTSVECQWMNIRLCFVGAPSDADHLGGRGGVAPGPRSSTVQVEDFERTRVLPVRACSADAGLADEVPGCQGRFSTWFVQTADVSWFESY